MVNWFIKKIKNDITNYDFRLKGKNNNYSKINFKLYNEFRILVSLSTYLSNGIILAPNENKNLNLYQIEYKQNRLVMFLNSPFSIHGVSKRSKTKFFRKYININGEFNFELFNYRNFLEK